jgi:hypothetical protein
VPVSSFQQERSAHIHQSWPHGDQPEISCLRLVVIGDMLRADATRLELLAEQVQACGLLRLSKAPMAPQVRPQQDTVHPLWRSGATYS